MKTLKKNDMKNLFLTIAASLGFTAATIAQNVPAYVSTNGLVGWWAFTGNANDSSVNANNGTVNGATITEDRFGNPNNAFSFDGSSSYIEIPHDSSMDVSNVTISAWYNAIDYGINITSFQRLIVSKREGFGWGNSFQMGLTGPFSGTINKINADWTIGGLNSILTFADSSLLTNTWFHFVYTHNNDSAKIYLNGNLVQSMAISGGLTYNTLPLRFGSRPNGWHPFNGKLDDIGIWNRALTVCEIQDLYSAQLNSSTGINAGNDLTVCQGDSVTLSGSGGSNYNWSGGINNNTAFVPSNSQDYVLSALSSNGCIGSDTLSVNVNILPNVSAGNDLNICQGDTIVLSGSGATTYLWDNNVVDGIAFNPTLTQSFVVTGTDANNCENTDTVAVTVNPHSSSTLNETGLDSVNVNGIWYTQNGQYTQLILNAAGCDSIITINVSLNFTNTIELPVQSFSIFPNPASSVVNIKADATLLGKTYSIYDLAGKVVLRGKLNAENTSIEVQNLSGGIYLFSLGEKIKQTFKVTKE